jgi:hypothetical protein
VLELEAFANEVEWPEPTMEPEREPVDRHVGPLDDPDDERWLRPDDVRRKTRRGLR